MIAALLLAVASTTPTPLTAMQKAKIKDAIGDIVLDGQSTDYRWLPLQPKALSYCGWINTKNSAGAFTGWRPYRLSINTFKGFEIKPPINIASDDPLDHFVTATIYSLCEGGGYDLDLPPSHWPR